MKQFIRTKDGSIYKRVEDDINYREFSSKYPTLHTEYNKEGKKMWDIMDKSYDTWNDLDTLANWGFSWCKRNGIDNSHILNMFREVHKNAMYLQKLRSQLRIDFDNLFENFQREDFPEGEQEAKKLVKIYIDKYKNIFNPFLREWSKLVNINKKDKKELKERLEEEYFKLKGKKIILNLK